MLAVGSLVDGKYKILRVVGKGGMSVVYQAVNEKANKIWAIKEVRKDGVQNFEIVKQNLIVETELLKRFNHPNLPSIIDVIDTEDSFLIVMDYIEGNSLSKAIETSGAQSQKDVIDWAKQLCDVLGYLHSRKPPIIYRDMKPANVMLKPDGNVSLIDFGTAREFKSSSVEDTTCLGTQGYAAPEQYGGHGQTDARTDIYCLGATMYHLVTGHNPSTPPYEMYPIRQWNPLLSSGLEEIIIKCTQRNPADRYQSCAELMYALENYEKLDIETKRIQNLKWKVFLSSAIMAVVMAISAVGFKLASNAVNSNEYDSFITQAENAKSTDGGRNEVIAAYESAIKTDGGRLDAYEGLLELYADDDGVLDKDEYEIINKHMVANESKIKANSTLGYANLCKELGDDLLFMSDSGLQGANKFASNWYKKAYSLYTDEDLKTTAEYMEKFAKIDSDWFLRDKPGDLEAMINEYFDAIEILFDDSNFESLGIVGQIKCCKYVSGSMFSSYESVVISQQMRERYEALLNLNEQKVNEIRSSNYYQQIQDKRADLSTSVSDTLNNIRLARQLATGSASGTRGGM